jgi:hypothetical protein
MTTIYLYNCLNLHLHEKYKTRKSEKNVPPQKIAIRPTHRKIKTKDITQMTPPHG